MQCPPQPQRDSQYEPAESLMKTLEPFLSMQVSLFLKWSAANSVAIKSRSKTCEVETRYGIWVNDVGGAQKYQAKSLAVIRALYRQMQNEKLDGILQRAGCLPALQTVPAKL